MKSYTLQFTVRGKGSFPLDMLRYDRCWPSGQDDVSEIISGPDEREVMLTMILLHKKHLPTYDRWASFGWMVTETFEPRAQG